MGKYPITMSNPTSRRSVLRLANVFYLNLYFSEFRVFVVSGLKTIRSNIAKLFTAVSSSTRAARQVNKPDASTESSDVLSGFPVSSLDDWMALDGV